MKSLQETNDAFYVPPHGKKKQGHPRTSYITYIHFVLGYHEVDILADEIATLPKIDVHGEIL